MNVEYIKSNTYRIKLTKQLQSPKQTKQEASLCPHVLCAISNAHEKERLP